MALKSLKKMFLVYDETRDESIGGICTSLDQLKQVVENELMDNDGEEGDYTIFEVTKSPYEIVKGGWKVE